MEISSFFLNMCDELVEFSEHDLELANSLKWIDAEAFKRGITFYEMVYLVLGKHEANEKAIAWRKEKNV